MPRTIEYCPRCKEFALDVRVMVDGRKRIEHCKNCGYPVKK